jgi:hypothetical protein
VNDADGWLPIHCLRILREPDEEVTPEDIVTIKLLVAGPSQPTFLSSMMIQMKVTLYTCRQSKGLVELQRDPPPMPLRALCRHTVRAELPHSAPCLRCCSVRSQ